MQNVRPQGNAHLQNQNLDSPETVFLQRHGASRCISVLRHLATAREKPRPPLSQSGQRRQTGLLPRRDLCSCLCLLVVSTLSTETLPSRMRLWHLALCLQNETEEARSRHRGDPAKSLVSSTVTGPCIPGAVHLSVFIVVKYT